MTRRAPLCAALGAVALTGCSPALVEFPRERAPFETPLPELTLPDAPEVETPALGTFGGGFEPGVFDPGTESTHHLASPTDPLDGFVPDEEPVDTSQCGAVTSQSGWCASLRDAPGVGAVVGFIGLDDGSVCDAVVADVGTSTLTATSLAVRGTLASWCDGANVIHTVDLSTGDVATATSTASTCTAMTEMQGGLAVLPQSLGRDVVWYPDIAELLDGGGQSWPVRPTASRLAADSTTIWAAMHQTDTLTRWLPSGVELEPLELDWGGMIYGMDAVVGQRVVLLDDNRDVRVFDTITGATLDQIPLSGAWAGLACFPTP